MAVIMEIEVGNTSDKLDRRTLIYLPPMLLSKKNLS
jgi:hypothetical protein